MAVYFRVGSVIPVFDAVKVASARSTEDLVADLKIKIRVIHGKAQDNLTYSGRLFIDDFHSTTYHSFAEIAITVEGSNLTKTLIEGDASIMEGTKIQAD